ncbi:transposase [Edaphobacter sp. 12200R-103]|uniref:REP-associated tyrosine transposase n=1 Tax=Edaphobacter sp. 12200R-103 TaxID=2703788 RepID=UPI001EE40A33|nr:transposase [Edaphobacter sp. 12200R-103]
MTKGLVRYQKTGYHLHFITFSCYQRLPYLRNPTVRDQFVQSLEKIRTRYDFLVHGYVVMPEHVHLLVSEPNEATLATAIQALKLSVSVQQGRTRFWQKRYYDFNVFTEDKRIEKLRYIHRNPVTRGLVAKPEDWKWSSFRRWKTAEDVPVTITTDLMSPSEPTSQRRDVRHPAMHRWETSISENTI